MTVYRADGEREIGTLFDNEGDALVRSGFTEPDMSVAPEELGTGIMPGKKPEPVSEWVEGGDSLIYTDINRASVKRWRREAASAALGGAALS